MIHITHITHYMLLAPSTSDLTSEPNAWHVTARPLDRSINRWWVEGAGHNNIEIHWRDEYYARVRSFVRAVEHEIVADRIAEAKSVAAKTPGASVAIAPVTNGSGAKKSSDSDDDDSTNGKSLPMEKVSVKVDG